MNLWRYGSDAHCTRGLTAINKHPPPVPEQLNDDGDEVEDSGEAAQMPAHAGEDLVLLLQRFLLCFHFLNTGNSEGVCQPKI